MEVLEQSTEKYEIIEEEFDYPTLVSMRDVIENLSKFNQVEILRIIYASNKSSINENRYGIHINLSDLTNNVVNEMLNYIKYVKTQEIDLIQVEQQKENYKNSFFK